MENEEPKGMQAAEIVSEDDYLEAERKSDIRHEYINGMIVAMAGATYIHNLIVSNATVALGQRLRGRCQVVSSDQRVHISATGMYAYPDVVVVCGRPEFHPKDKMTLVNPRLLVEVVSRTTEAYDRGAKFKHYQQIPALGDYVLVGQDGQCVEHYRRSETGEWISRVVEGLDAMLEIESLGVSLPLSELFEGVELVPGEDDEAAAGGT